ncbi:transcriptional regulator YciT [Klebsiella pneumoniae]|uniref:Transcriptional regulator YciT n=1 Tax=Klebsiella pneumoniae TaxID=573 RepID=A0A2X3HAF2_KLEPN|nr:transcriptional regulator YciT [Klebsiella pneumoniae]
MRVWSVPLTRQFIQQVHFSKAFIGIDGWQAETGFTGRDMMRADVVNAVLEKHCEAIILSDSSNSARYIPIRSVPPARFNRVITDDRLPDACREQLLRSGPDRPISCPTSDPPPPHLLPKRRKGRFIALRVFRAAN